LVSSAILAVSGISLGLGLSAIYVFPLLFHRANFDLLGYIRQPGGSLFYDNQLFPIDSAVLGTLPSGWWLLSCLVRLAAVLLLVFGIYRLRSNPRSGHLRRMVIPIAIFLILLFLVLPFFSNFSVIAHHDSLVDWAVAQRSQLFGFSLLTMELGFFLFLLLDDQASGRLPIFLMAASLVVFLLMTRWTAPLWHHVHFLWNLQFPWRFCGLLSIFTVGIIAIWAQKAWSVKEKRFTHFWPAIPVWMFFVLLGAVAWQVPANFLHRAPPRFKSSFDMALPTYIHSSTVFSDYSPWPGALDVRGDRIVQGSGTIQMQTVSPRRRILEGDCSSPCTAQPFLMYYPAWRATDSAGAKLALEASPESGLMRLALPEGHSRVQLEIPAEFSERVGGAVSFLSLLVLLAVLLLSRFNASILLQKKSTKELS
jgi:hypothetical protein